MLQRPLAERTDTPTDVVVPAPTTTDDIGRIVWLPSEFDDRSWRRLAACRGDGPDAWFPVGTTGDAVAQIAATKAVCHRCPVRLACLQYALVSHQEDGVWGGYSEEERREMRRRWRRLGRPLRIVRGSATSRSRTAVPGTTAHPAPEAG